MNKEKKKKLKNFQDLEVYQNSYNASLVIMKEIIQKLPDIEKKDLCDQMSHSCKAKPRLIAEGYAKKHQKKDFQKYLDDANGESNEMIVCLNYCNELYCKFIDEKLCDDLLDCYEKISRQVYNLSIVWNTFKEKANKN